MADQLVKVKFKKDGQVKEISAQIANNKSYQKSYGFSLLNEDEQVIEAEVPQKKIADEQVKSPVAEVEVENEITAQVETVTLEEKPEKKKGGRPKKSTTKTT